MKKVFIYLLLLFIAIVMVSLIVIIESKTEVTHPQENSETTIKLAKLDNIDKKIDYFNYKYLDRYIKYKEKNPAIPNIDIVTRVNIGLDNPFYQNTRQSTYLNKTNILVNKYIYLPANYTPNNLTEINNDFTSSTRLLVYEAKENFEKMCKKIQEEDLKIRAISAYRSYDYQQQLYNNYVKKDGKESADTYSAQPGYSEHQTGLVVDIDNTITNYEQFETTESFKWMQENAHQFGFILRYPKGKEKITGYQYEAWHYRYVGKEIATYIYENNLTLDEYFVRYIEK